MAAKTQGKSATTATNPVHTCDNMDIRLAWLRQASLPSDDMMIRAARRLITVRRLHMSKKQDEVAKRTTAAKAAIEDAIDDESSVGLFVSHHLGELEAAYWKKHTGTPKPTRKQVVDLLVLRSHWGGDAEVDCFDFTLPGDVTDYVISVGFDDAGKVGSLEMES